MKLFNELPSILPFYTDIRNQNRFKENVMKNCVFKLLSPSNALLPFMLKIPKSSPKPTEMNLIDLNGKKTDLSNNISKLKAIDFNDFSYCYYKGETLIFKYGQSPNFFRTPLASSNFCSCCIIYAFIGFRNLQ